jgi:phage terminase large subunit GpA-like protein
MNPDVEASSGRYNTKERPYWEAVLDAFDNPRIENIVVKKSTQVGGTVTLWAHLLWKAVHKPTPVMVVLPDQESAIEFRDRVYMNAEENADTKSLVPPRREWNTRWIDLQTMRCYLAWSGSAQKLRMRACQTVYLSEVDVFNTTPGHRGGDPNRAASERTKSFYSKQLYRESSPTAEPSTIAEEYEQTNQGRWMCPCPHCGRYQYLRFFTYRVGELAGRGGVAGYLDEFGQLTDPEAAEDAAHYVCKNGCRIEPHQINRMVERGVYADMNQSVDVTGKVIGEPIDTTAWGIHLWSIHSPTISLGEIAKEYVRQKRSGNLGDFMTNWCGLEYATRKKMPTWQEWAKRLAVHCEHGEVWPESYFVCSGADCQEDRVKWVSIAYGDRCTMWLLDWGEHFRDEELEEGDIKWDLREFYKHCLQKSWMVYDGRNNQLGRTKVFNRLVGIDSNHRTMDVHSFVKWVKSPLLRAIRGDHQVEPSEKYRTRLVEKNSRTGEPYPGGLEQWGIYVNLFKHDLVERISARPGQPGGFYVPSDAATAGKRVLQEICNEPPSLEIHPKTGRRRVVFKQRSGSIPVDYWDCCVYSRAMAEMVIDMMPGRPGWDASKWPT